MGSMPQRSAGSMSLRFSAELQRLQAIRHAAAEIIFNEDSRVRRVGIGIHDDHPCLRVGLGTPRHPDLCRNAPPAEPVNAFEGFAVRYDFPNANPRFIAAVAARRVGGVLERQPMRPLLCGAEIQNYHGPHDDGSRSGATGTLGCFGVDLARTGGEAEVLLSCSHVLNPYQNPRLPHKDIVQPGEGPHFTGEVVARLDRCTPLECTPAYVPSGDPRQKWNRHDIGLAHLEPRFRRGWRQAFEASYCLSPPASTGRHALRDEVYMVGCNGVSHGRIALVGADVSVTADWAVTNSLAWFSGVFGIVGLDDEPFSSFGDSGAVVLRAGPGGGSGEVLGMLFADDEVYSYAYAFEEAAAWLDCRLA